MVDTITPQMKVAVLQQAINVLKRDGWGKGEFHLVVDGKICHCAEGAIAVASGYHIDIELDTTRSEPRTSRKYDETRNKLYYSTIAFVEQNVLRESLPYFNDIEAESVDDVIAVFEKAIKELEKVTA